MKANVPEKIYIFEEDLRREDHIVMYGINQDKNIRGLVEYIRTDAFIEKACEYISEHVEYYMKKDKACNVPLCPLFATRSFIEDFKNYMKGE